MDPQQYPLSPEDNVPAHQVDNPLSVMQPGEHVICEVKRHPIGTIGVYAVGTLVFAIALAVAILTPIYATFLTGNERLGVILGCALVMALALLFTYIGVYVYQANRLIVTSDSVTQVEQVGLFDRHARQLSLANLEDVSARQDGLIPMLFGYGTLKVESAGEGGDYVFSFCPNPNMYARKIIAAHEEYIANRPDEMRISNRPQATVPRFNQPGLS